MTNKILLIDKGTFYQNWLNQHIKDLELQLHIINININDILNIYREITPDVVIIAPSIKIDVAIDISRQLLTYDSSISIIILASEYDSKYVFEALGIGVFDVVKWSNNDSQIVSKIKRKIILCSQLKKNKKKTNNKFNLLDKVFAFSLCNISIVVIGASTGGPKVIQQILSPLPIDFSIPIVVVQHMPSYWGKSLLNWLQSKVLLPVNLTVTGDRPTHGIYLADPSCCWIIDKRGRFQAISDKNARYGVPSIDDFFISIADFYSNKSMGILLTGMGDDGAIGLKKMKEKGAITIVQDKDSCTVYGMPQKALCHDNSHIVLDPISIRTILLNLVRNKYERESYTVS